MGLEVEVELDPEAQLTVQQRRFLDCYMGKANGSARRAAAQAGLAQPHSDGYKLLKHPCVRAALEARYRANAASGNETLSRITDIARANLEDCVSIAREITGHDADGNPLYSERPFLDLAKAKRRGLLALAQEVTFAPDGSVRLKLPSRLEALGLLAKFHGLLVERSVIEMRVDESGAQASIQARLEARARQLGITPPTGDAPSAPPDD